MDDDTLATRLGELGLSEKEVETYLSILATGEAKASEIADDTGVSKRYVYSISESLEDRGFVEVDDHVVPTTIRARPPSEVIGTLASQLDEMESALDDRFAVTETEPQQFEVIKSRPTVEKRISEYIGTAESEVMLSVPAAFVPEVTEELAAAVDRGVLVLLVLGGDDEGDLAGAERWASVVRTWDRPMPIVLTVDGEYGLVSPAEMVRRSNADQRAIALVQRQLVPVISGSFLGNYWPMATEAFVADPAALPATYRNVRHAVLQATLRRRRGDAVTLAAEVQPVQTDDDRSTVEGTVVETRQCLVEPATNAFPIEHAIIVESDGRRLSIGGTGTFLEDYEATNVTLRTD